MTDHRGDSPPPADLLNEAVNVLGPAAVDQQLGKRITPVSEQLQQRTR